MSEFKITIKDENYLNHEQLIKEIWYELRIYKNNMIRYEPNAIIMTFDVTDIYCLTRPLNFVIFNQNLIEFDVKNDIIITFTDNTKSVSNYIINCIKDFISAALSQKRQENTFNYWLEEYAKTVPNKNTYYLKSRDIKLFAGFLYYKRIHNKWPMNLNDILINNTTLSTIPVNFTIADINEYISFRNFIKNSFNHHKPLKKRSLIQMRSNIMIFSKFISEKSI